MRKSVAILLVALFAVTALVSCKNEPKVITHTITFDANGGDGEMNRQIIVHNSATSLTKNSFSQYRNCFLWWTTEADGSGTKYFDGAVIKPLSDITLYAQWEYIEDVYLADGVTEWFDGNFYTLSGVVTMNGRINVRGDVVLILPDGCTLNAQKGIEVSEGSSLTIEPGENGTGILNATGTDDNAGIGGNKNHGAGTITINGGVINAEASDLGAAIGGGQNGTGGTIIINGGTITANGKDDAAGIGGGMTGEGGNITINGGVITATGGEYSAAIGGGEHRGGGVITINDGTVTATGVHQGAGIGGGLSGTGGTITINGGTIEATGGDETAGIGGGTYAGGGTITINGGTIVATGGNRGAGIGGSYDGDGGTVLITGGTVSAFGGDDGAGIGGGYNKYGANVTITGGNVLAVGGGVNDDTPGIGSGHYGGADGELNLGPGIRIMLGSEGTVWSYRFGDFRARYMKTK